MVARVDSGGVDEEAKVADEEYEFGNTLVRRKECRKEERKEKSGRQRSEPIHCNCSHAYKQRKAG